MFSASTPTHDRRQILLLAWRRVRFTVVFSILVGVIVGQDWANGVLSVVIRTVVIGLVATLVFWLFENWPKRLPNWLARWVLQVFCVAAAMPVTTVLIYFAMTSPGEPPFWENPDRLEGFTVLTSLGMFFAPWIALAALVRQKDALARHQALAFELERSEFEKQALNARLHLLQAQVTPHFLFNTLANVQALVDAGSPRASAVLRSLVAYLRATVPRLDQPETTLDQELQLIQAYLELMHMRMPDRLRFSLQADDDARAVSCPPMTLLTLVENAVRHGIDPSEEGGDIEIRVTRQGGRCLVKVSDTGVGLQDVGKGLGTGLSNLRERLKLRYGDKAQLRLTAQQPHGVCAELEFPTDDEEEGCK